MKLILRKLCSIILAVLFLTTVACAGGKDKLSLARSKQQKDMNECLSLVKKKKHEEGIKCLEAYKSRNFGQEGATLADLAMADTYFSKKDYLMAAEIYQIFASTNPYHEQTPYAYYKAGQSYLLASPKNLDRDQTYLDTAVEYLGIVVKSFPSSSYVQQAQDLYNQARLKQAKRHFYVGRFYYRYKEYLAAAPRFQTIVTEYPKLGLDEQSFYYLIQSLSKTGQKDLALKYYEVFKEHFATSPLVKKIKL